MTDKEFSEEKKRIKGFLNKWSSVFELDQWDMIYYYTRVLDEEEPLTKAKTTGRWQYRHASIEFFLPETKECSDDELERTIIHEITHVILLPMSQSLLDDCTHEHEYTTVSLQRVIARAYLMGQDEKKKTQ